MTDSLPGSTWRGQREGGKKIIKVTSASFPSFPKNLGEKTTKVLRPKGEKKNQLKKRKKKKKKGVGRGSGVKKGDRTCSETDRKKKRSGWDEKGEPKRVPYRKGVLP